MKDTDLAYLAGIVDGEGSIGVTKCTNKSRGNISYLTRFNITNTNLQLLIKCAGILSEILEERIEDIYLRSRKSLGKLGKKTIYDIQINSAYRVEDILKAILPYLVGKKERAQKVLEFIKIRDSEGSHLSDISAEFFVANLRPQRLNELASKEDAIVRTT